MLESSTEFSSRDVAGTILVDGLEESTISLLRGLSTTVVLGQKGRESLVVQGLGGELNTVGQLGVVEELFITGTRG